MWSFKSTDTHRMSARPNSCDTPARELQLGSKHLNPQELYR